MSGHTPGPWTVGSHGWMNEGMLGSPSRWCGRFRRIIGDDGVLARVYCGDDTDDESDSRHPNILLITAAPELLAALKDAYDALDYAQAQVESETDRMHLTRCRRKIKPVIDAAEGRGE